MVVVAERQLLLCVEWLGEPVREQAGRGKNVLPSASVQAQSERSAANSQPVDGTFYATQIMANRVAVPPGITAVQLQNAIRSSISALFGDFGIGLVQQSLQGDARFPFDAKISSCFSSLNMNTPCRFAGQSISHALRFHRF